MCDVPCEMCPVMASCRTRLHDENLDIVATIMKCLDDCAMLKKYLVKKEGSAKMLYDDCLYRYCKVMGLSARRGGGNMKVGIKQ